MFSNKKKIDRHCFSKLLRNKPSGWSKKHKGLKINVTRQLLAYADDVNILGETIDTIQENTLAL
jgi:hypothetical protein